MDSRHAFRHLAQELGRPVHGDFLMKWIPIAISLALFGCHGAPEMPAPAQEDAQSSTTDRTASEANTRAAIATFVHKNADNLAKYAMKFANTDVIAGEIHKQIAAKDKKGKSPWLQPTDLEEIYAQRHYAPIFLGDGGLTARAGRLEQELHDVARHGLTLDTKAWEEALAALPPRQTDEAFHFTEEEEAAIVDVITVQQLDVRDGEQVRGMVASLLEKDTPLPRLRDAVKTRAERLSQYARQGARLEVLTADLAMRFAREMALDNMANMSESETESLGKKPTETKYRKVGQARARRWFEDLARLCDGTGEAQAPEDAGASSVGASSVDELIDALYPPHPGYRALMEARERYLAMPDWEKVSPQRTLRVGRAAKSVGPLRKRLAAEGYYHGDVSPEAAQAPEFGIYDNALRAAVRLYHETHQLAFDEDEGLVKSFWTSLNTPRRERLAQIEENLRRWHKTQITASPYYIFINVPDFHGEIWRDGKLEYRFPVVVGNAKKSCDPETKRWKYINATPLMHARMLYVEYNPYWNVPPRIEQEDYIEKINADPTWLETKGFEYYTENGHTVLRQLPSENNALGRVKFIFPNPHSTFLHDSPQKGLFRYPIRAFSHGCMRVWEPLELARRILVNDGQWKDSIATDIEDMETRRYVLKNRFDVFIDYFTVSVGSDGMVNFLADPYRYVRDALDPPRPKSLECTPNPKAWIARAAMGGEDVGAEVTDND